MKQRNFLLFLAGTLALFGLQIPLSRWWLGRYRYGPIEWLWRTLMYGTAQPMAPSSAGAKTPTGRRTCRPVWATSSR